jgi:hypothetical protein
VERGAEPSGVEQLGQARRVAVEVGAEHRPHPAHRGVPLALVEQLRDERPQLTAVAQEPFEGPRQAAVAIREVLAQQLIERRRRAFVDGLSLVHQRLELAPHDIDVHRHRGVLERGHTDAQRALERRLAIVRRSLAEVARQLRVDDDQVLDDEAVPQDRDGGRRSVDGAERDGSQGFHAPILRSANDSSAVTPRDGDSERVRQRRCAPVPLSARRGPGAGSRDAAATATRRRHLRSR